MKLFIFILSLITTLCYLQSVVFCQSNNETNITATVSTVAEITTVVETSSTGPPKNISCEKHNNDCKACVAYSECYYCDTDNKCRYKVLDILTDNECQYKKIHYLTCRVNFQYLMIGVGVLILIAFLIIVIFCCYCCCKKKGIKISKDDLKWARQRQERKEIALEKRKERAERTEEIRKKYGLVKDSNPYQRFDA